MVSFTSSSVVDSICPQGQEQIAQELNLLNGPWTLHSPALSRSGTFNVFLFLTPMTHFLLWLLQRHKDVCLYRSFTAIKLWLLGNTAGGFKDSSIHAEGKLISLDKTMIHCLAWVLNDKHKTGQMFYSVLPWLCPCKGPLFTWRSTRSFQLPFFFLSPFFISIKKCNLSSTIGTIDHCCLMPKHNTQHKTVFPAVLFPPIW